MKRFLAFLLLLAAAGTGAEEREYSFGVLSQRSAVLTAEYWNPILAYVSRKSGVRLGLRITRTAPESNSAIARGEYDFVYSNTIFVPGIASAGYQVIARPRAPDIAGQIVTLEKSPVRELIELNGKEVGFPSRAAFVGYALPMDNLLRSGIRVSAIFGGNQEGIMGQLKAGKVVAAGVNGSVMRAFAAREGLRYRVLWESAAYHDLPVSVHPRIPDTAAAAVAGALAGMAEEPEGAAVLAQSASVIQQKPPYGFLSATPADYGNYIEFYRTTVVPDIE